MAHVPCNKCRWGRSCSTHGCVELKAIELRVRYSGMTYCKDCKDHIFCHSVHHCEAVIEERLQLIQQRQKET